MNAPRSVRLLFTALALFSFGLLAASESVAAAERVPRVAAIVTTYYLNSHADLIVGRLLQTETLDGHGRRPKLELASLYTDQVHPQDISRALAQAHNVPIFDTIAGALTLGGDKLAVDGVLLIAEHGDYPETATGQFAFPKRRFFDSVVEVFERSERVVPIFFDKQLADNWQDASHIHSTAKRLEIPMLAGSCLPLTWRIPAVDVPADAALEEITAVSYHRLDSYGFHALEMAQCLAERRRGGETGVATVQCLTGDAVWEAGRQNVYDPRLLSAALSRLKEQPLPAGKTLEELIPEPVLFAVRYRDGLRVNILTLNIAVAEWAVAWRGPETSGSTLFWLQEDRPLGQFSLLVQEIESLMATGKPPWTLERTLLTTSLLDSLLQSKHQGGALIEMHQLDFKYETTWQWREPPAAPPGRPLTAP